MAVDGADDTALSGVRNVRRGPDYVIGAETCHELSSQNGERRGITGGRMPVRHMTPPQHGQRGEHEDLWGARGKR